MPDGVLRLTLEIEPGADPVTGWVREESGPGRPFAGWLELVHALDQVIATVTPDDPHPTHPDAGGGEAPRGC